MNKAKLLVSILLLLFSAIMFIVGAVFVTQNIGMIALIIFGGVGIVFGIAFLGMTMGNDW